MKTNNENSTMLHAQAIHFLMNYCYYNRFMALWNLSRTTWISRYQKSKSNLDLLEQEIVSGSGISWAIGKSAPHSSHKKGK